MNALAIAVVCGHPLGMKKLALTFATLGLLAAPVLACPNMESDSKPEETAPRTAEKDKKVDPPKKPAEAKPAEKAKEQPKTDTAKKATEKKPDKVSSR